MQLSGKVPAKLKWSGTDAGMTVHGWIKRSMEPRCERVDVGNPHWSKQLKPWLLSHKHDSSNARFSSHWGLNMDKVSGLLRLENRFGSHPNRFLDLIMRSRCTAYRLDVPVLRPDTSSKHGHRAVTWWFRIDWTMRIHCAFARRDAPKQHRTLVSLNAQGCAN